MCPHTSKIEGENLIDGIKKAIDETPDILNIAQKQTIFLFIAFKEKGEIMHGEQFMTECGGRGHLSVSFVPATLHTHIALGICSVFNLMILLNKSD